MAIAFQCPQCKKKLKAPDSAAGKTSPCPQCGHKVTCPEKIYDAEVVERSPKPEKPPAFNPYADLDDDKPYPVHQPSQAQEPPESRRPCPACGEMIVATAAKCRFCGEVFDDTLKKAKKKKKKSKSYGPDDEDLSTSEVVIAVLCSGIGCIAGLVWMIQGKPKGMKMFGISIVMIVVWNVINLVVRQSLHN